MDEKIIEQTTDELNIFLQSYLGRLEYGNLRKYREFPVRTSNSIDWIVWYETARNSISIAYLLYYPKKDLWEVDTIALDREPAINCFKEQVEGIPETRKQTIRKWVADGANVEKLCEGHELEELYTPKEIKFIYSIIS